VSILIAAAAANRPCRAVSAETDCLPDDAVRSEPVCRAGIP